MSGEQMEGLQGYSIMSFGLWLTGVFVFLVSFCSAKKPAVGALQDTIDSLQGGNKKPLSPNNK